MNIVITDYESDIMMSKKEVRQAVFFYGHCLMSNDHLDKLKIVISFDDSNFPTVDPRKCIAFCTAFYDVKTRNPTEFVIELNRRLTRGAIVKALAHEMVHVKQYSTGEMSFRGKETLFKNIAYRPENMDYYDWPWEIEAFGYEVGLVQRYRLFCKETGFNVRPNKRRKAPATSRRRDERMATAPRLCPVS